MRAKVRQRELQAIPEAFEGEIMPAVVSGQLVATATILVAFVITALAIFVLWIVSLLLRIKLKWRRPAARCRDTKPRPRP